MDDSPDSAKVSDQMPEEAPAEQVPEDAPHAPEGAAREAGRRHARAVGASAGPGGHRHASNRHERDAPPERESRERP